MKLQTLNAADSVLSSVVNVPSAKIRAIREQRAHTDQGIGLGTLLCKADKRSFTPRERLRFAAIVRCYQAHNLAMGDDYSSHWIPVLDRTVTRDF